MGKPVEVELPAESRAVAEAVGAQLFGLAASLRGDDAVAQESSSMTLSAGDVLLLDLVLARCGPDPADDEVEAPTMGDLARAKGVDKSTMSVEVGRLERAGLVRRAPDPADRRRTRVLPTLAGREAVGLAHRASSQRLSQALQHWSRTDRDRLATLLTRLTADLADGAPVRTSR